jgi:hypothetical protein
MFVKLEHELIRWNIDIYKPDLSRLMGGDRIKTDPQRKEQMYLSIAD